MEKHKPPQPVPQLSERFGGPWEAVGQPGYFVQLDRGRYTVAFGGQVRVVARILAFEGMRIRLCESGKEKVLDVTSEGEDFVVTDPDSKTVHHLTRLSAAPPELSLKPLHLPKAQEVAAEQIADIQRQLWERLRADGEAQQGVFGAAIEPTDPEEWRRPAPPPVASWSEDNLRWIETTSRNTGYLKELVARLGWIDAKRFGYSTAKAAILIALHSKDLPLMLAALPEVRRDVDAGLLEGEGFALLYDRLQLSLGERQRFASQIGRDDHGVALVLPVEDPAKVEELRKSMGMVPLAQYLKLFGVEEVRFSTACSTESPRS